MLIKPVNDFVIVSPFPKEEEKKGNIVIAEAERRKPERGRVVEVADSVKSILRGDVVVYKGFAGTELELAKDTFVILREEDIYLTVREDEEEVEVG